MVCQLILCVSLGLAACTVPAPTSTSVPTPSLQLPTAVPEPAEFIETTPYPTVEMPPAPPADFGLSLKVFSCYAESVNTREKTFTRDLTPNGEKTVVAFDFTPEQYQAIYDEIRAISYFSYPASFAIPTPSGEGVRVITMPHNTYWLNVWGGGRVHDVTWRDDIVKPTTREAENLRGLINLIWGFVRESETYKNLPPPNFGCA